MVARPAFAAEGVGLLVVSLSMAAALAALEPLLPALTFASQGSRLPWLAALLAIPASQALTAAVGIAGISEIEKSRVRPASLLKAHDFPRVALLAALAAAAFLVASGVAIGYLYLPDSAEVARIAHPLSRFILAMSLGLFLLHTADRLDPSAWLLSRIAFAFGIGAASLGSVLAVALTVAVPLGYGLQISLLILGSVLGVASLAIWATVFRRFGRKQDLERSGLAVGA